MDNTVLVSEALMYANCHRSAATKDNIVNVMAVYFSLEEVKLAKDLLWSNFEHIGILEEKRNRRDSPSRTEAMAVCDDIIDTLHLLADNQVKFVCYAENWNRIPKTQPESANIVVLADRLEKLEGLLKIHDERLSELRVDVTKNQEKMISVEETIDTHGQLLQDHETYQVSKGNSDHDKEVPSADGVISVDSEEVENRDEEDVPGSYRDVCIASTSAGGGPVSTETEEVTSGGDDTFKRPAYVMRREKRFESRNARWQQGSELQSARGGNKIVGKAKNSGLSSASTPTLSNFFISRVNKSVTVEKIKNYLRTRGVQQRNLIKTSHRDAENASFKLTIEPKDVNRVFNENFWPEGIWIRQWYEKSGGANQF